MWGVYENRGRQSEEKKSKEEAERAGQKKHFFFSP